MKGFTKDGKFHPIKPYNKKLRSKREPFIVTKDGVKISQAKLNQMQRDAGVRGKRYAKEKKFKPVLDEDGDIDIRDPTNQMKLDEIIEEETAKREERLIEDEDAYEELVNSGTDDVTAMGITVGAGTFLREHDPIAFRESLLDYADGTRPEIHDEASEDADEEESLRQGKYVAL